MKFILTFTLSKLLAYLVLLVGSAYAFMYKDSGVLIATFSASSAIIGLKTFMEGRVEAKRLQYENQTDTTEPVTEEAEPIETEPTEPK